MTEDQRRTVSRRGVLARLGAGALAVVGGTAAVSSPPNAPTGDVGTAAPPVDSDPVAETETPYAVWQYNRTQSGYEPTSPINVVFPLNDAAFSDVIAVFQRANWSPYPEEYARYAYDRTTDEYRLQEWTAAETHFGIAGRQHVRCWQTDGTASIQAHVDTPATPTLQVDPRSPGTLVDAVVPKHGIRSYADGRATVEALFEAEGWHVEQRRLALGNGRAVDHDGRASVIRSEGGSR